MSFPAFVKNLTVRRAPVRDDPFDRPGYRPGYGAWLWRRSADITGGNSPGAIARRIRFLYSGWKHQDLLECFRGDRQDHILGRLVSERPDILNVLVAPYQSTNWDVRTRLRKLRSHYQAMDELGWLFDPLAEREAALCRIPAVHPQLRLVLDNAIWFNDEGPLVFNLFLGDTRIFSLAFALRFEQGELIAHVGAVQGRNAIELPEVRDIYRELTHGAFGMRPRDLLIETFQMFCQHIRVERIFLVSSDHQQRRDALFATRRHQVHANYDEIWLERGAWQLDKSTFELPLHPRHRDSADIPSRKRRQYERRYAMLDAASADIATTLRERRGGVSALSGKGRERAHQSA